MHRYLIYLLACAAACAQSLQLPVAERTLANGLRVLVLEDHSIPNVALYTGWKVGSRNERPGITGLAHFFEHMMFTGGARYGSSFDPTMEAHGGANNAYTTRDVTVYQDWFPAAELPLILAMEADRMRGMVFDPEVVASERGVVASERRSTMEDPAAVLEEQLWAAAYTAHPYQWDVLGWMVDIENWQLSDLEQFFATHYAPNNAVMVVVGAVEADEVFAQVEAAMGAIPRGPERRPIHTAEPPQRGERRLVLEHPGADLEQLMAAWHIPETAHPDFAAIDVLEQLLLAGESSRLFRSLIDASQLCLDVSGGWAGYSFDPNLFSISLLLAEGADSGAAEERLYAELRGLEQEGPTARELQKARNALASALLRRMASIDGKADLLMDTELFFAGWRNLPVRLERIEAVAGADIQRVLQRYFQPAQRTVARLQPVDAPAPVAEVRPLAAPPTSSAPAAIELPDAELTTLQNGMRVLLVPDHEVPLLSLELRLEGGSCEDPQGQEGSLALLAALLDQGAGARDAAAFQETVAFAGGSFEAQAQPRWLELRSSFLAADARLALELLADVLRSPQLASEDFERQRRLALGAMRARKQSPQQSIAAYWQSWLFPGHVFARPVSGDEASLARISHDGMLAAARRQLDPGRAWLAVAGDFDEQEMRSQLEELFADWQGAGTPVAPIPDPKPAAGGRVLLVDKPDALQTYFRFGNLGCDWSDPDYPARMLANTVFGGRFTSRINHALRISTGLSYGAYSGFDDVLAGAFAVRSYTATATSREALELAAQVYQRFVTEGISAEELESARNYIKGQYAPDTIETAAQAAATLLALEFDGLPRSIVEQLFPRLDALELAEVNRVVRERFPAPDALRWVVIGQASQLRGLLAPFGEVSETQLVAPGFGVGSP